MKTGGSTPHDGVKAVDTGLLVERTSAEPDHLWRTGPSASGLMRKSDISQLVSADTNRLSCAIIVVLC